MFIGKNTDFRSLAGLSSKMDGWSLKSIRSEEGLASASPTGTYQIRQAVNVLEEHRLSGSKYLPEEYLKEEWLRSVDLTERNHLATGQPLYKLYETQEYNESRAHYTKLHNDWKKAAIAAKDPEEKKAKHKKATEYLQKAQAYPSAPPAAEPKKASVAPPAEAPKAASIPAEAPKKAASGKIRAVKKAEEPAAIAAAAPAAVVAKKPARKAAAKKVKAAVQAPAMQATGTDDAVVHHEPPAQTVTTVHSAAAPQAEPAKSGDYHALHTSELHAMAHEHGKHAMGHTGIQSVVKKHAHAEKAAHLYDILAKRHPEATYDLHSHDYKQLAAKHSSDLDAAHSDHVSEIPKAPKVPSDLASPSHSEPAPSNHPPTVRLQPKSKPPAAQSERPTTPAHPKPAGHPAAGVRGVAPKKYYGDAPTSLSTPKAPTAFKGGLKTIPAPAPTHTPAASKTIPSPAPRHSMAPVPAPEPTKSEKPQAAARPPVPRPSSKSSFAQEPIGKEIERVHRPRVTADEKHAIHYHRAHAGVVDAVQSGDHDKLRKHAAALLRTREHVPATRTFHDITSGVSSLPLPKVKKDEKGNVSLGESVLRFKRRSA